MAFLNEVLMFFISYTTKVFFGMLLLFENKPLRVKKYVFYPLLFVIDYATIFLNDHLNFLGDFKLFGWLTPFHFFYSAVAFFSFYFFVKTTVKECLMVLCVSLTFQHLIYQLGAIIRCLFSLDLYGWDYKIIYSLLGVLVYVVLYFLVVRRYNREFEEYPKRNLFMFFVSITFLSFCLNGYTLSIMPEMDNVIYHVIMFMLCVTSLFLILRTFDVTKSERDGEIISALLNDMQKKYEFSQQEISSVNRKYHDVNRIINALSAMNDGKGQTESLNKLREELDLYFVKIQTGNGILDAFLSEKYMACKNNDINFSFMVNGEDFSSLDPVDMYCLLGNLIDNAIEYLVKIENKDNRVVMMSAKKQGNCLITVIENYIDKEVDISDGLIETSKGDKNSHGWGLKSAKFIANKYGGEVLLEQKPHRFIATVSLFFEN